MYIKLVHILSRILRIGRKRRDSNMEVGTNRTLTETEESMSHERIEKLFNLFWKDLRLDNILSKLHSTGKPHKPKRE